MLVNLLLVAWNFGCWIVCWYCYAYETVGKVGRGGVLILFVGTCWDEHVWPISVGSDAGNCSLIFLTWLMPLFVALYAGWPSDCLVKVLLAFAGLTGLLVLGNWYWTDLGISGTSGTLVPLVPVKQRADWPFGILWVMGFCWYCHLCTRWLLIWYHLSTLLPWPSCLFCIAPLFWYCPAWYVPCTSVAQCFCSDALMLPVGYENDSGKLVFAFRLGDFDQKDLSNNTEFGLEE
jgi:hypothetical protein